MPNSRRRQKTVAKKRSVKTVTPVQKTNKNTVQPPTFRWGESYTSLLLGIIVVIIGILFVVSFARMQHVKQVTSIATNIMSSTPVPLHATTSPTPMGQQMTVAPTNVQGSALGSLTKRQTSTPTVQLTNTPLPTTKPTAIPTQQLSMKPVNGQQVYTVAPGDDLWHIAEKFYHSGYNYNDIVRVNKLENPSLLYSGMTLVIPQQITPEPQTVTPTPTLVAQNSASQQVTQQNGYAITGTTYTIQKDDDLWNIAVRAYGNGYRWTDIAKANNLTEPSKIFSGNVLTIPR